MAYETKQLGCRISTSTFDLLKKNVPGRHSLGSFVDEVILFYIRYQNTLSSVSRDFEKLVRQKLTGMGEMYSVTYSVTTEATIEDYDAVQALPVEDVSLEDVINNCKAYACEAKLYDATGFAKGWVHADGAYRLN